MPLVEGPKRPAWMSGAWCPPILGSCLHWPGHAGLLKEFNDQQCSAHGDPGDTVQADA